MDPLFYPTIVTCKSSLKLARLLKHNKNDFAQNSPRLIFARLSDHTINDCTASSIARESRSAESRRLPIENSDLKLSYKTCPLRGHYHLTFRRLGIIWRADAACGTAPRKLALIGHSDPQDLFTPRYLNSHSWQ
jgi:hypothetical protein